MVLIETSWNVKDHKVLVWHQGHAVLIETSWNVKSHHILTLNSHYKPVLIETSWNVKIICGYKSKLL